MDSDKKILYIADTLEECIMTYYDASIDEDLEGTSVANYKVEKPHLNFYDSYIKVLNYFLDGSVLDLKDETANQKIISKLEEVENFIHDNKVTQEEMRRALLFLDIKGFKNLNFSLDIITPDTIGFLFAAFSNSLLGRQNKKEYTIADLNFGVGNLAFIVNNALNKNVHFIGADNHSLMAEISSIKANLMQIKLDMYHEDALEISPKNVDLYISDLPAYEYENKYYHSELYDKNVKYFPYLMVEYLLKLEGNNTYLLLIDNAFFSQHGNIAFKEMLSHNGNIDALIALPESLFLNKKETKSIIVLNNKKESKEKGTQIFTLPRLDDQSNFKRVLGAIQNYLEKC